MLWTHRAAIAGRRSRRVRAEEHALSPRQALLQVLLLPLQLPHWFARSWMSGLAGGRTARTIQAPDRRLSMRCGDMAPAFPKPSVLRQAGECSVPVFRPCPGHQVHCHRAPGGFGGHILSTGGCSSLRVIWVVTSPCRLCQVSETGRFAGGIPKVQKAHGSSFVQYN